MTARNPYEFTWNVDSDSLKINIDFDKLITDTVRQMNEMEEQARLKVVVQFLRARGYYILEPDGTNK